MKSVFRRVRFSAFTLIELAMVLVIVSLMTGFGMKAMDKHGAGKSNCYDKTRTQLRQINASLDGYVRAHGVYPKPAAVNVGVTSTTFGKQSTDGSTVNSDDGGDTWIGALPFATLGLPASFGADCWGNKFIYSVTKTLSDDAAAFESGAGQITIKTGTIASASNITTAGAYAIISRGENPLKPCQRNYTGAKSGCFCDSAQEDAAITRVDKENCDLNNTTIYATAFNNGPDAPNYFDDLVIYKEKADTSVTNCLPEVFSWLTNCSAPVGTLAHGGSTDVVNSASGFTGLTTVACDNGTLSTSGVTTCDPAPTGCDAVSVNWDSGHCSAAVGAMADAQTDIVTDASLNGYTGSANVECSGGTTTVTGSIACNANCTSGNDYVWMANCNDDYAAFAHGGSTGLTNDAAGYTGTATLSCANGVPSVDPGATCTADACPATVGYTWMANCSGNYSEIASGAFEVVTNTAPGYSGTVNVSCTAGVASPSLASCNAACASETPTWDTNCTGVTGVLAHAASTSVENTAVDYTGSVTATCNNGTMEYADEICDSTRCDLPWGGTIAAAAAVTAYSTATPTPPNTCADVDETRTCDAGGSGVLSGSFTIQNCAAGCASQGVNWDSDCSGTAVAAAAGGAQAVGNTAPGFGGTATATCNAGGAGTFAISGSTCTVAVNGTCGTAHGASTTNAPAVNLCATGTETAVAGAGPYTWDCQGSGGGSTANCSSNKSCQGTPWGTVAHAYSNTAYSSATPAAACTTVDEIRTCTQGTLDGSFAQTSCSDGCTGTPWGAVAHGYNNTAYLSTNPTGACTASELRTCTNGTLSGSYTNATCTDGCAAQSVGTWLTNCSGANATAAAAGAAQAITNTAVGYSGSATATCDAGGAGTFALSGTSCAVDVCACDGRMTPIMTSASSPAGYTFSANVNSSNVWTVFDNSTNHWSGWGGDGTTSTNWVRIQFPAAVTITSYSMSGLSWWGLHYLAPKDWTLQGSSDGSAWTTVDTQTNQINWGPAPETRSYTLSSAQTYQYWRLHITANGYGNNWVTISDLKFYNSSCSGAKTALVPQLSSNTSAAGYTASANVNNSTAWNNFDRSETAAWGSNGTSTTNWIQIQFPNAVSANSYQLSAQDNWGSQAATPKDWTLQGSSDGSSWTTVDTRNNQVWWLVGFPASTPGAETRTYNFPTATYQYWRLTSTANENVNMWHGIGEFQLYYSSNSCAPAAYPAYCMSDNNASGQLGTGAGAGSGSSTPLAVSGGYKFFQISANAHNVCGLLDTRGTAETTLAGDAYCWGGNTAGQIGDNTTTQRTTPTAVTMPTSGGATSMKNFISISVGTYHTCALDEYGNAFCWGDNTYGQLGDNTTTQRKTPTAVSAGSVLFKKIVAGGDSNGTAYHTCALDTGDYAYCWGRNNQGQLGDGTTTQRNVPTKINGYTWSDLYINHSSTCGITTAGAAYCWGNYTGHTDTASYTTPQTVDGGLTWSAIANGGAGGAAVNKCGITTAGAAYCWGDNGAGQVGDGTTTARPTPVAVTGGLTYSAIQSGTLGAVALTTAGAAYKWSSTAGPTAVAGGLTYSAMASGGQGTEAACFLGTSALTCVFNGSAVANGASVTAYSSATPAGACTSESRTCTNGSLSGSYSYATCTAGCAISAETWDTNCSDSTIAAAAGAAQALTNEAANYTGLATATCNAGGAGTFALSATSCTSTSCGLPWGGTIAHGASTTAYLSATPAGACTSETRTCTTGVLSGSYTNATCTAGCAAQALTWDTNCSVTTAAAAAGAAQALTNTALGYTGSATGTCNAGGSGVIATSGTSCTVASSVPADGSLYCWGANGQGAVGDGTTTNRTSPVAVTGGLTFTAVSQGGGGTGAHTCAITSAGAAYCWGENGYGQVGNNSTTDVSSPTAVNGGLTFAKISAGYEHTCGVTTGGAAYCWGEGTGIGDGSSTQRKTPTAVTGGHTFSEISVGFYYACGVKTNGTIYCWGENAKRQLGDTTTTDRTSPVAVTGGITTFTSVSANNETTCGLTSSGAVYCWGEGTGGEIGDGATTDRTSPTLASAARAFTAIAGGGDADATPYSTNCGITAGGVAYCWGENSSGQVGNNSTTDVSLPTAVSTAQTFSSITVGEMHACGLTAAGAAYCWGENGYKQIGDNSTTDRQTPVAVSGGLVFASIAAGDEHTCGVTGAGVGYCWGYNAEGQVGDASTSTRGVPTAVGGGLTWSKIVGGAEHTCGLTTGGATYCWGYGTYGQIGNGGTASKSSPTLVSGGLTFTQLSANSSKHTCALTAAGAAYCWGLNTDGQLGDNTTTNRNVPTAVSGGLTFTSITTGMYNSCGMTASGLYCWGTGNSGANGDGTSTNRKVPTAVTGSASFTALANGMGAVQSCALQGTSAYCWGNGNSGANGDGATTDRNSPVQVGAIIWAYLSKGAHLGNHICALTTAGAAYCWGDGSNRANGSSGYTDTTVPTAVGGGFTFADISTSYTKTCATRTNGSVYCWGGGYLGAGSSSGDTETPTIITPTNAGVTTFSGVGVSGGEAQGCAIYKAAYPAYCWSDNLHGELGVTSPGSSYTPIPISYNFTKIVCNNFRCCGISSTGDALCWGDGANGAIGNGATADVDTPTLVLGGYKWSDITSGDGQTCGVTTSGVGYCWGENTSYELGNGGTTASSTPTAISGGLTLSDISAGSEHTCALTTGGAAYCWGWGSPGSIGDGNTTDRSTPRAVTGGHTFTSIHTAGYSSCGIKADGDAYCWGDGYRGDGGDDWGSTTPTLISGGYDWATISEGQANSSPYNWFRCGVTTAGVGYCWGNQPDGQVGDNSTTTRKTPVAVSGGYTFSAIHVGEAHSCGLTTSGVAYCWGANNIGQLGTGGTGADQKTPVAVAGGYTFKTLATGTGDYVSCLLRETCTLGATNVANGATATAYLSATPTGSCTSESRTCINGSFTTGSYTAATCTAGCAASTATWGYASECSIAYSALAAGGSSTVYGGAGGYYGQVTLTCNAGGSGAVAQSAASCYSCAGYLNNPAGAGTAYYCYFKGTAAQTCDTVCAARNGCLNAGNLAIGSGGTNAKCDVVKDGVNGAATATPSTIANAAGCYDTTVPAYRRGTTATTCAATVAGAQRFCACTGVSTTQCDGGGVDACFNGTMYNQGQTRRSTGAGCSEWTCQADGTWANETFVGGCPDCP